jgi:hypothetical protein
MAVVDPGTRLVRRDGGKLVSVYDKSLYRAACRTPGCGFVLPDPSMRFRTPE